MGVVGLRMMREAQLRASKNAMCQWRRQIVPDGGDVPRQNAAWRSLIERDGPPPETFVKVWAETRCRWHMHVALAAKYTTSGRPDHRP